MIQGNIIIKFFKDKAYITEEKSLNLSQLELPEIAKSFNKPAYWKTSVVKHFINEKKLFLQITEYKVGEVNFSYDQNSQSLELNEIEIITFKGGINTTGLLQTLGGINHEPISNVEE
jgi:hypothetical protein